MSEKKENLIDRIKNLGAKIIRKKETKKPTAELEALVAKSSADLETLLTIYKEKASSVEKVDEMLFDIHPALKDFETNKEEIEYIKQWHEFKSKNDILGKELSQAHQDIALLHSMLNVNKESKNALGKLINNKINEDKEFGKKYLKYEEKIFLAKTQYGDTFPFKVRHELNSRYGELLDMVEPKHVESNWHFIEEYMPLISEKLRHQKFTEMTIRLDKENNSFNRPAK